MRGQQTHPLVEDDQVDVMTVKRPEGDPRHQPGGESGKWRGSAEIPARPKSVKPCIILLDLVIERHGSAGGEHDARGSSAR